LFQDPNINVGQSVDGRKYAWRRDFAKHQIAKKTEPSNYKLELDYYLEEPTLPDSDKEFDILVWWKANGLKYPILQMIARDFLAIPISTLLMSLLLVLVVDFSFHIVVDYTQTL